MHVAAANPLALTVEEIDPAVVRVAASVHSRMRSGSRVGSALNARFTSSRRSWPVIPVNVSCSKSAG